MIVVQPVASSESCGMTQNTTSHLSVENSTMICNDIPTIGCVTCRVIHKIALLAKIVIVTHNMCVW